jgi:hypothetical protein
MKFSNIVSPVLNGIEKLRQFGFAGIRARQMFGVVTLIAVLCVTGCT